MTYDYLVVGAGIFGCVMAERLANGSGKKVKLIDKRTHMGGNCFSEKDVETGIEIHRYGTHIFHTDRKYILDYLSDFMDLNGYCHQVLSRHKGRLYQMPVNLQTINSFYNVNLTPSEAKNHIAKEISKIKVKTPSNLEEKALSVVGKPLYEAFIKNYTKKHWGVDPKNLPPEIIDRFPVRFDYDKTYFNRATWQGLPVKGFANMLERIINSPNVDLELGVDYFESNIKVRKKIIFSGEIDRFFRYKYGRLGWRSIFLERKMVEVEDYQGTSVINYPDPDVNYTRIHEPRHLYPERRYSLGKTVIFYETPVQNHDEPFYPVNREEDVKKYKGYRDLACKEKNVIIGGRLGAYRYYDMDETVEAALKCYTDEILHNPTKMCHKMPRERNV